MDIFRHCDRQTLEVIQDAVDLAYGYFHHQTLPIHLAFCLLYEPKWSLFLVLNEITWSMNSDLGLIRKFVRENIEKQNQVVVFDIDRNGEIAYSADFKVVLKYAHNIANRFRSEKIEPLHLLVWLLESQPEIAEIFEYWMITRERLKFGVQRAIQKSRQETDLPILYEIDWLDEKQKLNDQNRKYI